MTLPGEHTPEFIEILPFTPANRNNLIGWIAGRSDPDHYGDVIVYDFPKTRLVDGPLQVEARIDQNAQLSGQLSLWNQQGSRVRRGPLLVIPIGHALLYAEAIYLQADRSPMSSGRPGLAQSSKAASRNGLEGTWFAQVTLRDCATNAQIGLPFNSLVTFHRGGTISESTSSRAFAIGQRGDGQGLWRAAGHHTYSQRMVSLINFDTAPNLPVSPGFFAGWSTVSHTLELTDDDHATSSGTNEFYKVDGTLYRSGCSTAVAVRFE